MSKYSLEIEKSYAVPAEMVYDAWLNPDSVKEWMCPGEGVTVPAPTIDARVGGEFHFDMDIGKDEIMPHGGVYKELKRPNRIQFTWKSKSTNNEDTIVSIDITSVGKDSCRLTLKHELLPTESARDGHQGGWTRILETLHQKIHR